jgi:hypothetical protein
MKKLEVFFLRGCLSREIEVADIDLSTFEPEYLSLNRNTRSLYIFIKSFTPVHLDL